VHRGDALALLLLWLLTGAVFWTALEGQFVWDDFALIVNNATLQDPSRLGELLTTGFWNVSSSKSELSDTYTHVYRPLVSMVLFVQYRLFGLEPRGFHAVSLGLHLLIVTIVFGLLRRTWARGSVGWIGAFLGAALFAIHPSRAESVAWISSSTELWMGLFVFAGYMVWVARPSWTIVASVLFGLALFAKETAIVVPVVLLVDMYVRYGAIDWKRWAVAVGAFGTFAIARIALMPFPATQRATADGMARRVMGTLGHYIEATFWPWQPVLARGFRHTDCTGALVVPMHTLVIGGAAVAAMTVLAVSWRSLRGKAWFGAVGWFFLFLAPVLNIVDLGAHGLAGDRFLYVPLFGVSALLATGVDRMSKLPWSWQTPIVAVVIVGLVACGAVTHRHVGHFRDTWTLWRSEVEQNPDNLYALELVARQESPTNPALALSLYKAGFELANAKCNAALSARFVLLATARLVGMVKDTHQDRLGDLRALYDRIVDSNRILLTWPEMEIEMSLSEQVAESIKNDLTLVSIPQAIVTMRTLDLPRAEGLVEQILESNPDLDGAWLLLARIQARQGRFAEAEHAIEQARERAPNNPGIEILGEMLVQARRVAALPAGDERARKVREAQVQMVLQAPEAARRILGPALERQPGDPLLVLAYVRAVSADRRFDLAIEAIDRAEAAAPEEAEKWQQLRRGLQEKVGAGPGPGF
jgi:tetratricopeptide (TPR) repeat protein